MVANIPKRKSMRLITVILSGLLLVACASNSPDAVSEPPVEKPENLTIRKAE